MSKFFALEGVDGCGKSTQLELCRKFLESQDDVKGVVVVSPYTTEWGDKIHNDTIFAGGDKPSDHAKILAFMTGRQHLYEKVVLPALREGYTVIADRWDASTFSYNTFGKGTLANIIFHSCLNFRKIKPTTIFLDIDFNVVMERRKARGSVKDDDFDTDTREAFESVQLGLQHFRHEYGSTDFETVDANGSVNEIHENIKRILCKEN